MERTVLNSYRSLQSRFTLVLVLLAIAVVAALVMAYMYTQALQGTAGQQLTYAQLLAKANATQAALNQATNSYNNAEHNLTVPYTKTLYNEYSVNIPGKNVTPWNTTTSYSGPTKNVNMTDVVTYYSYGFSFNAIYPGYILVNASSSGANTQTNTTWEFLVSNYNIIPNSTTKYYDYQTGSYSQSPYVLTVTGKGTYKTNLDMNSPRTTYAPTQAQEGSTVMIPVTPGTVHVWITNFANQSIAVIYSMKYLGFHTS